MTEATNTTDATDPTTLDACLRLGSGFQASERAGIIEQFASLEARLRSFRADAVDLQLTVKERDGASQRTTLEAWIAGWPRLVATSELEVLTQALTEVRDDLIRQLTDAKNRTEPRNNRQRRNTAP